MAKTKKSDKELVKVSDKDVKKTESFDKLIKRVEQAREQSNIWSQNQDKWHRMRMRIKKPKTFPFIGCSNIRLPTLEKVIRKFRAGILNSFFGIRPIVQVVPGPTASYDSALKLEKLLDHLCMDVIPGFEEKVSILIDQTCEKGFYLAKPFWQLEIIKRSVEVSTDIIGPELTALIQGSLVEPAIQLEDLVKPVCDKLGVDKNSRVYESNTAEVLSAIQKLASGEDNFTITVQDVTKDYPDFALVSPERCYVPTEAGFSTQDLPFIVHEFFLPLRTLKTYAREDVGRGWIQESVNDITSMQTKDVQEKASDLTKDTREGITRLQQPSEQVRIWEIYGWFDIDGDGNDEKVILTVAPDFRKKLREVPFSLDSGKFPFVKFAVEFTDDRWFAPRGMPEILEDIVKEIDVQHMQKIDQQTIRNSPMFLYRVGYVNPQLVQFIPNQGVPVKGTAPLKDTLDVVNFTNPNAEYSYEREEMLLNTQIQELFSQPDFSLQSMINRREPRTLGEVELQSQALGGTFGLDVRLQTRAFSDLLTQIWEFWNQYGPDSYEFSYFGPQGLENVKITREDIQGKYSITVRGNDVNTNPKVKIQKAQFLLQGVSNPVLLQSGVITPIQQAAAWRRAMQELGIHDWEQFINQDFTQKSPSLPPVNVNYSDLQPGEKAQLLQRFGVQPDVEHMALEDTQKMMEIEAKANGKTSGSKGRGANPRPPRAA